MLARSIDHYFRDGVSRALGVAAVAAGAAHRYRGARIVLGGKLTADAMPVAVDWPKTIDPNDAAFVDIAMPVAGGDTLEASRVILEKLQAMQGG